MACFDLSIVAIVQFIGEDEVDNFTNQIFDSIKSSEPNIRYVFLCLNKDSTCKVKIYQKGQTPEEIPLPGKDFYNADRNKGALPAFFGEYVFKDKGTPIQSNRYLLITIGHGAGFGIMTRSIRETSFRELSGNIQFIDQDLSGVFQQLDKGVDENINQILLFAVNNFKNNNFKIKPVSLHNIESSKKLFAGKFNNLFDKYEAAQPTINYLTSFQLAEIIKTAFLEAKRAYPQQYTSTIPFDLIIQVNCYMQSIENGYALRNITKYLCATEIGFPTYGIAYQQLFETLSRQPDIAVGAFFETVVNGFKIQRMSQKNDVNTDNSNVALSLNSLECYQQIFDSISGLAGLFISEINTLINNKKLSYYIYEAREHGRFTGFGSDVFSFLDLSNFLTDLSGSLGTETAVVKNLQDSLRNVIQISNNTIAGPPYTTYQQDSPMYPNSFGIFFPRRNRTIGPGTESTLNDLLTYYFNNKFSVNQNWDNFIGLYLNMDMEGHI